MSFIGNFINIILHLDKYLSVIIQSYGPWTYAFLFIIVFCETGLVVTPFLPGDSILFATGALVSSGKFNIFILLCAFYLAAVIGDTVNYYIGQKIGNKILKNEHPQYIKKEYLKKADDFYKKHGSMTIVIGRFIPIIRTFVPFVAGIGKMNYLKFIIYNMLGGFLWVTLFLGGGYIFGNLPFLKQHFSYILIAVIIVSIIPAIAAFIKEKNINISSSLD